MSTLLQNYVTRQAELGPDATAIVSEEATLNYRELEHRSNQFARLLRDSGCGRGDRVCLLAPKSAASIVALLAIYKADCIYVPLDSASPAPRLAKMIASAEPRCILAARPVARLLDEIFDADGLRDRAAPIWLDDCASTTYSSEPVFSENQSHDAAHLLFTSGSTGTPKGVVITHANVMAFVEWAVKYFGITDADRHSGHPPLHFDLSMFDIFGTFAAGAALYLVPAELAMFPNKIAEFIRQHELTQWFSVPSLLTYMANLDAVRQNDFPALKRVLWCGEVLATPTLIYWMRRLSHITFTNLYGPTEATIASSYYTMRSCPRSDSEPIPIGSPCEGESLRVLDTDLRPVPIDVVGDLYIGGVGLSPGYWRNPDATRAAFVHHDAAERLYRTGDLATIGADGQVYFRGRADSQIKSRGYRVELGEIEAALEAFSEIDDCAVVAIPSTHFDGQTICCAYVPSRNHIVTPARLRKMLAAKLPPYMLPAEWLELGELPKNQNGKVDRPLLKNHFQNRASEASRQRATSRPVTSRNHA